MNKQDLLTVKLSKHFSLHPSRQKTFTGMIIGALSSSNVHQQSLARYAESKNPKSGLRKVERFFKEEELSPEDYARTIVELSGRKGKFDLSLDRTNWRFGDKEINYLVLSWRITKKIAVPLLFVELDKAGNSNTQERIDLLQQFDEVFGFHRIQSLTADREFIGEKWFRMLGKYDIPYYIRVKENTQLPWGNESISAKNLFHHLQGRRVRLVEKQMYGGTVYFAGTRSKAGDLVIVMTNQRLKPEKILIRYRFRWSIEEIFRKLKTSGFHWENTHMKKSERLVSLLIIISLALFTAFLMGLGEKIPWRKTVGYPLFSIFKQGLHKFQFFVARSLATVLDMILNLLKKKKIWPAS